MGKSVNIPIEAIGSDESSGNHYPGPITHLIASFASLNELRRTTMAGFSQLTPKERTVLESVAEGLSNPQIAKQLSITRATVQNHRASIRRKLNINSDVDYVKIAVAHDLISL